MTHTNRNRNRTRSTATPAERIHAEIKREFDVEYIGGVGYCGPNWQAATLAAADRYRAIGDDSRADAVLNTAAR